MADEKQKSAFSFSGAIGKLNINSDSGTMVTGSGANVQIGDNNSQTITQSFSSLAPLDALGKALCDEVKDQDEVIAVVEELKLVEEVDEDQKQDKLKVPLGKLKELCEKHGPKFAKAGGVALKAAIKGDAPGAIISGVLTLLEEFGK